MLIALTVTAVDLLAYLVTVAVMLAFRLEPDPLLPIVAGAAAGASCGAALYTAYRPHMIAGTVKGVTGTVLALLAVLCGFLSGLLFGAPPAWAVTLTLSVIGSFLMPWAVYGTMRQAVSGLPAGRPLLSRRQTRAGVSLLALGLVASATCLYLTWVRPNQLLWDSDWLEHATAVEQREACHAIIRSPWGNSVHDAFLILCTVGNHESVPLLVEALRLQPDAHGGPGDCTTAHCAEALRSLTGETYGTRWQDWHEWWEQTGRHLPAAQFRPRRTAATDTGTVTAR